MLAPNLPQVIRRPRRRIADMFGQASPSFERNQLRAIMQAQASRSMAAASDQAVIKELAVETLLDPNYVTPIGLTITPDGGGGVSLEVIGGGGSGPVFPAEAPVGVIDNSNVNFTISQAVAAGFLQKNGVMMRQGAGLDYTRSGANLTLAVAPDATAPADHLWFTYLQAGVAGPEVPVGAINSINQTFTISSVTAPGFLVRNGLVQRQGAGLEFTRSGVTLTLATAPDGTGTPDWLLWIPL